MLLACTRNVTKKPRQVFDEALHGAIADRLHEHLVAVGQLTGDAEQNTEDVTALGRRAEKADDADAADAEPRR